MIFHTKKMCHLFNVSLKSKPAFSTKILGQHFSVLKLNPNQKTCSLPHHGFSYVCSLLFWLKYATRISTQKKKKHTKVCQRGTKKVLSFHHQFSSGARLLWGCFLLRRVVSSIVFFRSQVLIFDHLVVLANG